MPLPKHYPILCPIPVPVMLNWVALSSCRRRSSSQSPAPSTPLEEEKGGGAPSLGLGERGLQTVLTTQMDERDEYNRGMQGNSTKIRTVVCMCVGGGVTDAHTTPQRDGCGIWPLQGRWEGSREGWQLFIGCLCLMVALEGGQ